MSSISTHKLSKNKISEINSMLKNNQDNIQQRKSTYQDELDIQQ